MLKLEEINEEIKALENSNNTSYSVCQKLAILYIVRDHYTGDGGNGTTPMMSMTRMNTPTMQMGK